MKLTEQGMKYTLWLCVVLNIAHLGIPHLCAQAFPGKTSPISQSRADEPALHELLKATVFEAVYVGVAGDRSHQLETLFVLISSPQEPTDLQTLFDQGSSVAKLYAYLGAILIYDSELAKSFAGGLKNISSESVSALDGCDFYVSTVG